MISYSIALIAALVLLIVIQASLVAHFWFVFVRHQQQIASDDECPKAAVILCVRGNDPTLPDCLRAIFELDYPAYIIRIMADHADDPACETVRAAFAHSERGGKRLDARLIIAPHVLETCSLKCSLLVQAVEEVKDQVDLVALIDADTQPHASWLRELAAAFRDPQVGAATGVRWYVPDGRSLGSMMRSIWNAAAIVQMYCYQIAWGGSLAFRTSVFQDGKVLEKWSHAFCEDTMTQRVLREQDLKLKVIPSLIMSNRESCGAGSFVGWMRRQLLTSRLYHPAWFLVILHCLSSTIAPVVCGFSLIYALIVTDFTAAWLFAAGLLVYEICAVAMLFAIESAVRSAARERRETLKWRAVSQMPRFLIGLLATQLVYCYALVGAILCRKFDWRGIDYDVRGAWNIRMRTFKPFRQRDASSRGDQSL